MTEKSASQTSGLVGRAQRKTEMSNAPSKSTPPMVGVPALLPCSSCRRCTSSCERIGWPSLSEIKRRITQLQKSRLSTKDVTPAATALNVMYWKTLNPLRISEPKPWP